MKIVAPDKFLPTSWLLFFPLALIIPFGVLAQQPFSYTQYMDNLTPINPAASLLSADNSIHSVVRRQWLGIPGAPVSYLFNGNIQLKPFGAIAGGIIRDDEFAVEHLTEINAFFAKKVKLADGLNLAVSLNAGGRYYHTNYASLDANDPVARNDVKEFKPNAGFGAMLFTDSYYIALSVPEISVRSLGNASLEQNNLLRNNYYMAAGFKKDLDDDFEIKPSVLISVTRGVPVIADISAMIYSKEILGFGLSYRTDNEIATILSVDVKQYHLGYSYQFGVGTVNIGGFSNATHEVTLAMHFGRSNQVPVNFNH